MSKVLLHSSELKGRVVAPPSKSAAHRALICSYLAGGGTVKPIINSNDMRATVGVINSLKNNEPLVNCIESGSTMRFMIPVAATLGRTITFSGEGSLLSRTVGEYINLLPKHNVEVKCNGYLPMTISGKLKNGNFEVAGDVSSQYITGLLLALANLDGDSAVVLTTELQSKPYVDMTVKVMKDYGVEVTETDFGYLIHGGQNYKKIDYNVEGDWSQAAFFLVAGAINGDVEVCGLDMNSTQGDKAILDVLKSFGADVQINESSVVVKKGTLKAADVNAANIPDLVPIIAVMASFAEGKTVISGAERLRYKESDRIESVVSNLRLLGVDVEETGDGMIINGQCALKNAKLNGFNDHRILMAFSVAALAVDGEVEISDAESINKSYPSFFEDYNKLGGKADVI
ncbi:MAG: 3-phosphoshikimate 1-carboxyvinyltransferase [Acetobacter sp.]|nr:3-phosphoshikimate 1-carboxyvinyltransferase [Bacteroides sp.]MCM1340223.1 3-phosphoshikimate 1-carboxyvinyltransferase [Acetobacter sp.]MCM1432825.1 3-phosphoshikimate 1-carboxyvinyltransferase [Clostridiales bacterium]